MEERILTPEQIKQVKGLGCLQDKRYTDIFNVRVLTRNGRITTEEIRTIAEAADTFGSGKVAMTSRLTIEIQGVKYDNIEPMIAFLKEKGLDTMIYKNLSENGVDVSGGEAQKIAIARALYKDVPFSVLDEPTAALDPVAKEEIYAKFKTSLAIKPPYLSALAHMT